MLEREEEEAQSFVVIESSGGVMVAPAVVLWAASKLEAKSLWPLASGPGQLTAISTLARAPEGFRSPSRLRNSDENVAAHLF